jgi:hypothetical protein
MRVHCRPKHFSTTKIISKISWNIRISSIRKNNPPACPLASGYRTCMTAGRPSYNCRKKNCEQWRSKNFCLTKPVSALLSGEELNSCSHCDQFLGNYTAAGDFSLPSFLLVVQKKAEMFLFSASGSY